MTLKARDRVARLTFWPEMGIMSNKSFATQEE